ncbi:MAG: hypothetical protein ABIG03_01935 [Candidatus Eisenbacteria bacterium]
MRTLAIALTALFVAAMVVPAAAQEMYFEYGAQTPSRGYDPTWPPDGSPWHELYPGFCNTHDQTDHDDADGNGQIDACEHIWLGGERHHVEWIGPTYVLERPGTREEIYVEDGGPLGRQTHYHEIAPVFCREVVTQDPILDECQNVIVLEPPEHAGEWHVKEINTDIRTRPDPASPVERSTWGKIKSWFGDLF